MASAPLPLLEHSEVEITQPKPDLTVGFKKTEEMRIGHALHVLRPSSLPVPSRSQLIFPSFTMEAKGSQAAHFSKLQNQHNSSHMLRSLEVLREKANAPGWKEAFYDKVTVVTAHVTKDSIAVHAHWARRENDETRFYTRELNSWFAKYKDYDAIRLYLSKVITAILKRNRPWVVSDLHLIQSASIPKRPRSPNDAPPTNLEEDQNFFTATVTQDRPS